jgi:hypothetical protein
MDFLFINQQGVSIKHIYNGKSSLMTASTLLKLKTEKNLSLC